jgi:hypothetical protein
MADLQNFFTEYLPKKLIKNPDLCTEINAIYQFDLDGFGIYTVDLTGEGEVRSGACEEPGCVVTAASTDFEMLLDNPASAMMLFSMGKLKVSNIGLALSLQKILS